LLIPTHNALWVEDATDEDVDCFWEGQRDIVYFRVRKGPDLIILSICVVLWNSKSLKNSQNGTQSFEAEKSRYLIISKTSCSSLPPKYSTNPSIHRPSQPKTLSRPKNWRVLAKGLSWFCLKLWSKPFCMRSRRWRWSARSNWMVSLSFGRRPKCWSPTTKCPSARKTT